MHVMLNLDRHPPAEPSPSCQRAKATSLRVDNDSGILMLHSSAARAQEPGGERCEQWTIAGCRASAASEIIIAAVSSRA